jgi:hypothetical protein
LERDSTNRSIHYITFKYDALVPFTLYIHQNAKRNLDLTTNTYSSGQNFRTLSINCQPGQNINFTDNTIFINSEQYSTGKEVIEDSVDLVFEMVCSAPDVTLLTLCKLTEDKAGNVINLKVKPETQRLKTMNMWIEIHDVFHAALDSGECLICCTNNRNTIFLPCKHSCCCSSCSHSLRIRNNPCPICKNSK